MKENTQGDGRTRQNFEQENLHFNPILAKIFQTENNVTVTMLVKRLCINNQTTHERKYDISACLIAFLTPSTGTASISVTEYIRVRDDGDLDVVK